MNIIHVGDGSDIVFVVVHVNPRTLEIDEVHVFRDVNDAISFANTFADKKNALIAMCEIRQKGEI